MKSFYTSIAQYYDDIFPLNRQQAEFIVSSMMRKTRTGNVLDIGCGTGNLSVELAKHFKRVEAIDLDPEMISVARSKAGESDIHFTCLNMLDIRSHFSREEFDVILSFGNTIAHLDNAIKIGHFFEQTKELIKPGGKLFLQIVNYDRILEQNIQALPLINNKKIKFERYYEYSSERNKINFTTLLTVKEKHRFIKNRVELYPLTPNEVRSLLQESGYENLHFYGGFNKEKFSRQSQPLIVVAD